MSSDMARSILAAFRLSPLQCKCAIITMAQPGVKGAVVTQRISRYTSGLEISIFLDRFKVPPAPIRSVCFLPHSCFPPYPGRADPLDVSVRPSGPPYLDFGQRNQTLGTPRLHGGHHPLVHQEVGIGHEDPDHLASRPSETAMPAPILSAKPTTMTVPDIYCDKHNNYTH